MRPIKSQRSALRYPLDGILGSEAQVRLLRVLINEVDGPLSVSEAARLAELTPAGARKALERLEEYGFVQRLGSGRATYEVSEQGVGAQALAQLFSQEQRRYDEFVASLRAAVSLAEVKVAWVEALPSGGKEPIQLSAVVDTNVIGWIGEELRSRLLGLEKQLNLMIEIAVFTRADTPEPAANAQLLWGTLESSVTPDHHQPMTHTAANDRALGMARVIADLIRSDPSMITRARQHVDRLLREGQGAASGDLAEWRQLLETYSPERVQDLVVATSSRGERLRQSSPFFAVLTPAERDRLMAEMEKRR